MSGIEFIECPTCATKAGTPVLCDACLNNRRLIHEFDAFARRVRAAVRKPSCRRDDLLESVEQLARSERCSTAIHHADSNALSNMQRERDELRDRLHEIEKAILSGHPLLMAYMSPLQSLALQQREATRWEDEHAQLCTEREIVAEYVRECPVWAGEGHEQLLASALRWKERRGR